MIAHVLNLRKHWKLNMMEMGVSEWSRSGEGHEKRVHISGEILAFKLFQGLTIVLGADRAPEGQM